MQTQVREDVTFKAARVTSVGRRALGQIKRADYVFYRKPDRNPGSRNVVRGMGRNGAGGLGRAERSDYGVHISFFGIAIVTPGASSMIDGISLHSASLT